MLDRQKPISPGNKEEKIPMFTTRFVMLRTLIVIVAFFLLGTSPILAQVDWSWTQSGSGSFALTYKGAPAGTVTYQYNGAAASCQNGQYFPAWQIYDFQYTDPNGQTFPDTLNQTITFADPIECDDYANGLGYGPPPPAESTYGSGPNLQGTDSRGYEYTITASFSVSVSAPPNVDYSTYQLNGIVGYVNPKYVVVAVEYAPPGSSSYVDYTSSKTVSSTYTVINTTTNSTTVSTSVTASGGLFGFLGASNGGTTETTTNSNTLTQQSQDTHSVTASYTNTSDVKLYGPGQTSPSTNCGPLASGYIGVDHDCDIIKVWLNPVMLFTDVNGSGNIQWNGYGYSELDTVAPIHIVDVLVGCLNGDIAATDSRCTAPFGEFQRTWAVNENWPTGQGPGLTQADLNDILSMDPWGQCTPSLLAGSSACPTYSTPGFVLLPPQFTISDQENIPYHQGATGNTYTVSATNSMMQGQQSTTTHSQTYGYETTFKATVFLADFSISVGKSQTLTTAFEVNNQTTTSNTFTGTANIVPPTCVGNPCNPAYPPSPQTYGEGTEFDIFIDNFFGTFVFVPSAYN